MRSYLRFSPLLSFLSHLSLPLLLSRLLSLPLLLSSSLPLSSLLLSSLPLQVCNPLGTTTETKVGSAVSLTIDIPQSKYPILFRQGTRVCACVRVCVCACFCGYRFRSASKIYVFNNSPSIPPSLTRPHRLRVVGGRVRTDANGIALLRFPSQKSLFLSLSFTISNRIPSLLLSPSLSFSLPCSISPHKPFFSSSGPGVRPSLCDDVR